MGLYRGSNFYFLPEVWVGVSKRLGFRVWGVGLPEGRFGDLGCREGFKDLGIFRFRVWELRFRPWDFGLRLLDLKLRP